MEGRLLMENAMFNLVVMCFGAPHSLRGQVWLEIASCNRVAMRHYKERREGALKQRDVIAGDEVTAIIRRGNFEVRHLKSAETVGASGGGELILEGHRDALHYDVIVLNYALPCEQERVSMVEEGRHNYIHTC